jgi:hypothetical protein
MCLLATIASCASVTKPRDDNLQAVVDRFAHDLRWKYKDTATARVIPDEATAFSDRLNQQEKDLNITAWEIRKVQMAPDGQKASVTLHLSYYLMPSTVVQDEDVVQEWELRQGRWLLVSQKGGPLPVPVPVPKEDKAETGSGGSKQTDVQDLSDLPSSDDEP